MRRAGLWRELPTGIALVTFKARLPVERAVMAEASWSRSRSAFRRLRERSEWERAPVEPAIGGGESTLDGSATSADEEIGHEVRPEPRELMGSAG